MSVAQATVTQKVSQPPRRPNHGLDGPNRMVKTPGRTEEYRNGGQEGNKKEGRKKKEEDTSLAGREG